MAAEAERAGAAQGDRAALFGRVGPCDAFELCRQALADPGDASPGTLARLEAELVANAWLDAGTHGDARERLGHPAIQPSPLELWRVNAAMKSMLDGDPSHETLALLRPVLEHDVLAAERESLLGTFATLVLIASDELDVAQARCDAIIDASRTLPARTRAIARSWLP